MAHPVVDHAGLGLPEASDLVGGRRFPGDPGVDGVFGDAETGGDVVCGQPWLRHVIPFLFHGLGRPTCLMIPVEACLGLGVSGCGARDLSGGVGWLVIECF